MSSPLTVLAVCGEAFSSLWTLVNSVTNGVMGFAGFPEHRKDEERPGWATKLIYGLLVVLLILFLWLAIH